MGGEWLRDDYSGCGTQGDSPVLYSSRVGRGCAYFDTPSRIFLFLIDAFGSSDGSRRTYESAEMAANAFGSDKPWAAGFVIEYYGLMTTVIARHLTASASNAQFRVKLGIDDGLAVQVIGVQEFWYLFAYKLAELRDAALNIREDGHPELESPLRTNFIR